MTADSATPESENEVRQVRQVRRVRQVQYVSVVALLLAAACATKPGPRVSAAALGRAQALAAAGCHTCLAEALATFEAAGDAQRAFDTAILLALREKEIGIPERAALEKVAALAPSTPAARLLVELVNLAPIEPSGMDPEVAAEHNAPARRNRIAELRPQLDALVPSVPTAYLRVALDCNDAARRPQLDADRILAAHRHATLLRYRLAVCGLGDRGAFDRIRAEDPRWTEIAFFQARRALAARPPDLRAALDLFAVAAAAFPQSAAIVLARAHAERAYGDLEPALASYDKAIALVPTSREPLLGRAITLSHLERHEEVIATATRMIELGTWLMGDAFYWRARSRYALKSVEEAWSDAENAIKFSQSTDVYTLAGVIAYDRQQLDAAKYLFNEARRLDQGNCTAHSYYALVHAGQDNWEEATPVFSRAMTCFVDASAQTRREIDELEAATVDPVYKARLLVDQRKKLAEGELKGAQAGFNAAQGLLRAGRKAEAMTHLEVALAHPAVRAQAEALRKLIG